MYKSKQNKCLKISFQLYFNKYIIFWFTCIAKWLTYQNKINYIKNLDKGHKTFRLSTFENIRLHLRFNDKLLSCIVQKQLTCWDSEKFSSQKSTKEVKFHNFFKYRNKSFSFWWAVIPIISSKWNAFVYLLTVSSR